MTIVCTKWVGRDAGSLRGFCDLKLVEIGMEIRGCMLFEKNVKAWVNFPKTPKVRNGELVKEDGKQVYNDAVIEIDKDRRDRFQAAAIAAVMAVKETGS